MKKYLIGSAIALSLVIGVGAQSASALTQAEASAIISALSLNAAQAAAIQALVSAPAVTTSAPSFTRSLTVGSTGSDVSALQQWLVANGYLTMPAGTAYGYFGGLTKNAVAAYQAHEGISPAVGYFGPLTIAHLSANTTTTTTTTTTTGGSTMCPVGMTCTVNTTGGTVGLDNTDGSVTLSTSSYVSSGQTIKKGETKDLIAVQLQATSGKVALNRFDVHFSVRPWLFFGQFTLKDSSGNVIATKSVSSPADSTEVTVGTDYLVRFDNVNYVVNPGPSQTLVVSGTVLAATDKVVSTQAVTTSIPAGSIRTINGRGYTDSLGGGISSSITITATGSTGDVLARISPSTPAQKIVTTSTSQTTSNVVLGVYSFKSQNNASTLNSLNFNINNSTGAATTSIFSNVRLVVNGVSYGANSLAAGAPTFTNLNINLAQDTWTDVTLQADVASSISAVSASSSLVANATNIVGTDTNYNTVTASGGNTVVSNDVTFLTSGLSVSAIATNPGTSSTNQSGIWQSASPTFTFTLTNTGNSDVYISKNPALAFSTSTAGSSNAGAVAASTTLNSAPLSVSTGPTDPSTAYIIQAGTSRTFTWAASAYNTNSSTGGARVFAITAIKFGTGAADGTSAGQNAQNSITFGLENLKVQVGS